MPVQILRPGVQGPCQLPGRGVAGVLDGKPDRLLRADRVPLVEGGGRGGVDAAGQQPVGVGPEHLHRRMEQRAPALPVILLACRLAQEDDELGLREAGERPGRRAPGPRAKRAFELGDGLGGSQSFRGQTCTDRCCEGAWQVVGRVPMEGEPAQSRQSGIGSASTLAWRIPASLAWIRVRSSGIRSSYVASRSSGCRKSRDSGLWRSTLASSASRR